MRVLLGIAVALGLVLAPGAALSQTCAAAKSKRRPKKTTPAPNPESKVSAPLGDHDPTPPAAPAMSSTAAAEIPPPAGGQRRRTEDPLGRVRIALIPTVIAGPHGHLTESEVIVLLARSIEERPTLEARRADGARIARAVECGSASPCVASIVRELGAELGLRAAVDQRFDPPLVGLQIIRTDGAVIAEAFADPSESRSLEALERRAGLLLDHAGHPRGARLVVEALPKGLKVSIEPAGREIAPGVFEVVPGTYRVKATGPDARSAEAQIAAIAGRDAAVRLVVPPSEPTPFPWLWVGLAVVGVAGATTLALALGGSLDGRCVCVSNGAACSPCQ